MNTDALHVDGPKCPGCGETMVPAEAALKRTTWNVILCGMGSSILQFRLQGRGEWTTHMTPWNSARASYCTSCGALLLTPSVKAHCREIGLE